MMRRKVNMTDVRRLPLVLLLAAAAILVVATGAAAETATSAQSAQATPQYRIYPLRNGVCKIAGDHVDDVPLYKNAKIYVGKKEWQQAVATAPSWGHGPFLHAFLNDPLALQRWPAGIIGARP